MFDGEPDNNNQSLWIAPSAGTKMHVFSLNSALQGGGQINTEIGRATSSTCLSYSRADLFMIFTLVLFFAGFALYR